MTSSAQWVRVYQIQAPYRAEIVHAHYVEHRFARHAHEHFVVGLVEQGIQQYRYRGAIHTTPAGQVFFVNGAEPHTGEPATAYGYVYRTLCLGPESLLHLTPDITQRNELPYLNGSVVADGCLFRDLRRLHDAVAANAPTIVGESWLLSAVRRILERHAEKPRQAPAIGKESAAVRRVRDYLDAHFAEDVSLAQIALLTSLSSFHIARAFSQATGLPPHAYLESLRIRRARQLLRSGMSVVETALAVGYPDQSHFTHRFRRHTGYTPAHYRSVVM